LNYTRHTCQREDYHWPACREQTPPYPLGPTQLSAKSLNIYTLFSHPVHRWCWSLDDGARLPTGN